MIDEKPNIVYERKSPEGDRILAWLKKLRFHCASYDEISMHFNKPKKQVNVNIINLRNKGRINIVYISEKTTLAYLPGEEQSMGEYVAKKKPQILDRYQKMKRTRKLRGTLPKKAFETYYENTHKKEQIVSGVARILELNN